MKLSREKYKIHRETIRIWLSNKPDADLRREISYIAVSTGCPVILVLEYIMELQGRTETLIGLQNDLMKFYDVTEIL